MDTTVAERQKPGRSRLRACPAAVLHAANGRVDRLIGEAILQLYKAPPVYATGKAVCYVVLRP